MKQPWPYYQAQWMMAGKIGGGTAPPFSPTDIAGLKLWLKADALALSDGVAVTSWNDASGTGYNLTPGIDAAPIYKTSIVNGKPVVRFDGSTQGLGNVSDIGLSQPNTSFVVGKMVTGTDAHFLRSDTGGQLVVTQGSTGNFFIFAGSVANDAINHSGAFHIFAGIFSGGNGTGYVDGSLTIPSAAVGTNGVFHVMLLCTGITVGATFYPGDIAEILIYNSALSGTDRGNVEAYLKTKYAIP